MIFILQSGCSNNSSISSEENSNLSTYSIQGEWSVGKPVLTGQKGIINITISADGMNINPNDLVYGKNMEETLSIVKKANPKYLLYVNVKKGVSAGEYDKYLNVISKIYNCDPANCYFSVEK
jgi:hypothetical protein